MEILGECAGKTIPYKSHLGQRQPPPSSPTGWKAAVSHPLDVQSGPYQQRFCWARLFASPKASLSSCSFIMYLIPSPNPLKVFSCHGNEILFADGKGFCLFMYRESKWHLWKRASQLLDWQFSSLSWVAVDDLGLQNLWSLHKIC